MHFYRFNLPLWIRDNPIYKRLRKDERGSTDYISDLLRVLWGYKSPCSYNKPIGMKTPPWTFHEHTDVKFSARGAFLE